MKEFKEFAIKINSKKEFKEALEEVTKIGYKYDKNDVNIVSYNIRKKSAYLVFYLDGVVSIHSHNGLGNDNKTFKSIKEFKEHRKSKETKKGKLTIIVSKNYKDLYEDNLALVNHILLDTVRGDFEWVERVQKYNLNITLYTDKNDPELFKKSFGKFKVKLMDKEECNNNLKGLVLVSRKGVDKSRLQDPEYVEQMIKEGKILHAENFNKSLVMDNGSTISNVKEGESKSIEELHVEHKEQSFNKIKEEEFYKGLKEKLESKGVNISYFEEFNKIPSHILDALKYRTPQEQNSIGKSYNKKHLHLEEPVFNPQSHYNNEFGSLYKMSEQLGLNTYEFDILKRVVRCRKKGQFEEDLQKTKDLIDLYLIESKK